MTVVGYDYNGFIVRNSWGAYWGDNGYCHFPYEDWGKQNEIWTTIDLKGKKYKTSFFQRIKYITKFTWKKLTLIDKGLMGFLTVCGFFSLFDNEEYAWLKYLPYAFFGASFLYLMIRTLIINIKKEL